VSSEHEGDGHAGGADEEIAGGPSERHGQDDRPARRSRWAVVAVAAAVLLTAGGGAYWASSADSGGAGRGGPAPLRLDGARLSLAVGEDAKPVASGGSTYRLTGTLPGGPASAAVWRPAGTVSKDQAKRLAAVLGVPGAVGTEQGSWRVGSEDGGPGLLVSKEAPGAWSYARVSHGTGQTATSVPDDVPASSPAGSPASPPAAGNGSGPAAGDGTASSDDAVAPVEGGSPARAGGSGTPPVPEQQARAAVAPVLDGLGLSGARVDASETVGALRLVTADPVVGGLPTHGWATTFQIDSGGTLTMGYGRLAELSEGDTYPVVSARQAFEDLGSPAEGQPDHGLTSCVVPMPRPMPQHEVAPAPGVTGAPGATSDPADPGDPGDPGDPDSKDTLRHDLPCVAGNGHPVEVRGATFGLAPQFVSGTQTLVPAWLFDTAQAGVSRTRVEPVVAVDPAYIDRSSGGGEHSGPGVPSGTSTGAPGSAGSATAQPGGPGSPEAGADPADPVNPADPQAPRPVRLTGYWTSGTDLTVSFWGGVCSTYSASVTEQDGKVLVLVTDRPDPSQQVCPAIAKRFTRTVRLKAPLGTGVVVDASTGDPVKASGGDPAAEE
jgi:hypothetical protein